MSKRFTAVNILVGIFTVSAVTAASGFLVLQKNKETKENNQTTAQSEQVPITLGATTAPADTSSFTANVLSVDRTDQNNTKIAIRVLVSNMTSSPVQFSPEIHLFVTDSSGKIYQVSQAETSALIGGPIAQNSEVEGNILVELPVSVDISGLKLNYQPSYSSETISIGL